MKPIYFDNASTTKALDQVIEKCMFMLKDCYGNPSSLHQMGFDAEMAIKKTSNILSDILQVSPEEIYYTSGGTESNNMVFFGAADANTRKNHIITCVTEHPSVLYPARKLSDKGYKLTLLKTDEKGHIDLNELEKAINDNTLLVSIMHVNNETGVTQDIEQIGRIVQKSEAIFHVDGVQSFCKYPVNFDLIDAYSFSGHKIHGMKGIGGLYIKKGTKINPFLYGGGQQKNIRPGTENTPGIFSLGIAAEYAYSHMKENKKQVALVKNQLQNISTMIEGIILNGSEDGSDYILNMSFTGIKSEVLLHSLEQDAIFVSTGSACSSNDKQNAKQNVIALMGKPKEVYESALRFSFSPENTTEEAQKCIISLKKHMSMLRRFQKRA